MKHHPNCSLKNIMVFSALAKYKTTRQKTGYGYGYADLFSKWLFKTFVHLSQVKSAISVRLIIRKQWRLAYVAGRIVFVRERVLAATPSLSVAFPPHSPHDYTAPLP